jgi:hypothetical protein
MIYISFYSTHSSLLSSIKQFYEQYYHVLHQSIPIIPSHHRLIISKQKSEQFSKFRLDGIVYLRIEDAKDLAGEYLIDGGSFIWMLTQHLLDKGLQFL